MTNPEKDFAYEISVVDFSYKKIVINNIDFKDALFAEFSELTPKPKRHWYFNHFISDNEWAENCTRSSPNAVKSHLPVAADYIPESIIDKRASRIEQIYNQKLVRNRIDQKYYGRFIKDTTTVQLLNDIKEYVDAFERYVLTNSDKGTYKGYSKATCKNIIALTDKLKIQGLKQAVLNSFIDDNGNLALLFKYDLEFNSSNERQEAYGNYKDLKNYADDIFRRELSKATIIIRLEETENNKTSDTLQSLLDQKEENKFCTDMPLKEAIAYFAALAIPQKDNDKKPYLNESQFKQFIKRAFLQDESIGKLTLGAKHGGQESIRKYFYKFFELSKNENWDNSKRLKDKYVRLLTDNFTNYEYKAIFDNFNKGNHNITKATKEQIEKLLKY